MNRWLMPTCLAVAMLVTACGEPPSKEMNQAQGAIDAARAAGGDRYATTEYSAAVASLKLADEAVIARDYRLALNHALESREHAQNAAREAADTKARLRVEAERGMTEIATVLAEANARFQAAERARVPARALQQVRDDLAAVNSDVQKAGAAIQAGDYLAAKPLLDGVKTRIPALLTALDARTTSQSARRRR
jgi:hypothetical protein